MTAFVRTKSAPAVACDSLTCFEVATIRILVEGELRVLCPIHWSSLRSNGLIMIQIVAELERPSCFKVGCRTGAVSVMSDLDGRSLPVCEKHLEDLSWVTPSPVELEALQEQERRR